MNFTKDLSVKTSYKFDEKNYLLSFKLAEIGKQGGVIFDYNYCEYDSFEELKENIKYSMSDFHFEIVNIYNSVTTPSIDYRIDSRRLQWMEDTEYKEFYDRHPIVWTEFTVIDKVGKILNCVSEHIWQEDCGIFGTIYDKVTGNVICKIRNIGEWLSVIIWIDDDVLTNYVEHGNIKLMDDINIPCWPQSIDNKNIHLRQYSTVLYETYNELEQIFSVAVGQTKHLINIDKIDWTSKFIDQYIKKYNFPFVIVELIASYTPLSPPYW